MSEEANSESQQDFGLAIVNRFYPPSSFSYNAYQVGTTRNKVSVEIDVHLGGYGIDVGRDMLVLIEIEQERLANLFGSATLPSTASVMRAHGAIAVHIGWENFVYLGNTPIADLKHIGSIVHQLTALWICEATEIYAHVGGKGWDSNWSHGEALSRVIGNIFMPGGLNSVGIQSVATWLNTPGRPDWVSKSNASETDIVPIGCAVAFLHFLHDVLHTPWFKIVSANGATLEEKFQNLFPGHRNGYSVMMNILNKKFPVDQQVPNTMAIDSPFTVGH